jgi:hypothetical protein
MSSKCQASHDPADAFIALYDQIEDDIFLSDEADELLDDLAVRREITAFTDAILKTGTVPSEHVQLPQDDTRNREAIISLSGLDRVLRYVHPNAEGTIPDRLRPIFYRYTSKGHLNNDRQAGLLLPRLMDYGAPEHRPDKFERFCVVRVEPERTKYIDFIQLGTTGWPTVKSKEDLVVACLPFLDTIDDVVLNRINKASGAKYQLGPKDHQILHERVAEAIEKLDESEATVALLPEGALSGSLLNEWKSCLAKTTPPGKSNLALIIAGSGPVNDGLPPCNCAVALDRQGNKLWEQNKLCDFTLVEDAVKNWQLPGLGAGDLEEDITLGKRLVVAETTLGRIAILICEDLGRCDTRRIYPRDLGISHMLVPVFDAPLHGCRWHRHAAENYLNWIGSRVVVSNSRVVGHLQDAKVSEIGTAFGISPERLPGTWNFDASQVISTNSPTHAVNIKLKALGPIPSH